MSEKQRGEDAKRHGLLRFELFKKIDKFLSLNFRNFLISPLEGEKKFLSELCELRNFREGDKKYKNKDCGTESGMTVYGANLMMLFRGMHRSCIGRSALLCRQGKKNYNRLGILEQHKIELEEVEPLSRISNAHYHSQRIAPSPRWVEGIDSVVSFALKSKNLTTHENNLFRKELSALVTQYLSNFFDANHSLFLDTVFSRFTSPFLHKRTAFTIAEVLITLGIIGIVATMTLPTIITNYKVKVLENQFKKADSIIQQAIQNTANEYGYSSITELNMTGHCSAEGYKYYLWLKAEMPNINEIWKLQFLKTKSFDDIDAYRRGMYCNNFWGEKMSATIYSCVIGGGGYMILPDGVTVSPLYAVDGSCHNVTMRAAFDTNGPHKGPNRIGYDIFIYQTAEYETLCNPNIVNSENYKGCYYWAHRNVSPQDSSKPYWDVLYKPLSYWKK